MTTTERLVGSWSVAMFIVSWLNWSQQFNETRLRWSTFLIFWWYNLQSSPQQEITRLRSELFGGQFFGSINSGTSRECRFNGRVTWRQRCAGARSCWKMTSLSEIDLWRMSGNNYFKDIFTIIHCLFLLLGVLKRLTFLSIDTAVDTIVLCEKCFLPFNNHLRLSSHSNLWRDVSVKIILWIWGRRDGEHFSDTHELQVFSDISVGRSDRN